MIFVIKNSNVDMDITQNINTMNNSILQQPTGIQPPFMDDLDRLMSGESVNTDDLQRFTGKQIRMWMNHQTLLHGKTDCPICRSHIQTYKRTISLSQVYWLILLNKYSKGGYRYVDHKVISNRLYEALGRNASDYPLMAHWGLIECSPVTSGEYKITSKGIEFIEGKIKVPKYLYFANNKVFRSSPELISFDDSKNFDLTDITKL